MSRLTEASAYPERLATTPTICALPNAEARAAFDTLRRSGLDRFSQVTDRLYRGGQPSHAHLIELRRLGVDTIISLRREERKVRRAEQRDAEELGMKFLSFPYYGVFGASQRFFHRLLAAIRDPSHGVVYVHCQHGRDRTSLAIALHLVIDQGWEPETAWQLAAIDYGHNPSFWYSELRSNFDKMVRRLRER